MLIIQNIQTFALQYLLSHNLTFVYKILLEFADFNSLGDTAVIEEMADVFWGALPTSSFSFTSLP